MRKVTVNPEHLRPGNSASGSELLALVYRELRHLAMSKMANESPDHTLQPTALVHEAWLRLSASDQQTWQNRAHFFGAAAEAMRRILIESARRKQARRRGGGQQRLDIDEIEIASEIADDELLAVNEALEKLASEDPQKAELVKLRYFGGLSFDETAEALNVSVPTAKRWWAYSRAWVGTNSANGSEVLTYRSGGATSNSLGYISVGETSGDGATMFFVAPAKFLGDKRAAYNGILRFSLKQSAQTQLYVDNDVILRSTNMMLGFRLPGFPGTNWATFDVPLNENVGWITHGHLASRDEFLSTLQSLTELWIRAEYSGNNVDRSDLDDVMLMAQPSGPAQPILSINTFAGVTITGQVGRSYHIEYQSALSATSNWQSLADVILPSSPFLFIDQASPAASSRFYRARLND